MHPFARLSLPVSALLITFAGLSAAATPNGAGGSRSPNVIIIYSDDHGRTDLGAYRIDSNLAILQPGCGGVGRSPIARNGQPPPTHQPLKFA